MLTFNVQALHELAVLDLPALLDGAGDSRHQAWQGSFEYIIISNVPLSRSTLFDARIILC